MSICLKCTASVNHEDERTLCDECVKHIVRNVSFEDAIDIQVRVMTHIRRNEARWKAKGAGYQ